MVMIEISRLTFMYMLLQLATMNIDWVLWTHTCADCKGGGQGKGSGPILQGNSNLLNSHSKYTENRTQNPGKHNYPIPPPPERKN